MTARTEKQSVQALTYFAQPAYVDDSLRPYTWYQALVVAGAHQHGLPPDYRQQLATVRNVPDPDTERRTRHRTLLRNAGLLHLWPDDA